MNPLRLPISPPRHSGCSELYVYLTSLQVKFH
nr:MAG TPA: hypothetical protein [Bacteriophage sp.]